MGQWNRLWKVWFWRLSIFNGVDISKDGKKAISSSFGDDKNLFY